MKKITLTILFVGLIASGCSKSKTASEKPANDNVEAAASSVASPSAAASSEGAKANVKPGDPITKAPARPVVSPDGFVEAALNGDNDSVVAALAAGQDANYTDEGGRTAMMLAGFNGHTAIVSHLINHGGSVTSKDQIDRTALMYTCTGPNPDTVNLLLSNGAKVNAIDNHEAWTPLMFAAAEGLTDVVKILLDHKADVNMKDVDGDTAGNFAQSRGHKELAAMLHGLETK